MAKKTLLDNIIESIKGIDGRLIKQSGTTKQMISDLNYKVVAPAKSAADSAVKTADAAVASAKVTSASVSAIASAIAEARAGANDAMSSIQQAVANASSDAAKIRSDVAKVQDEINTAKTANSASVEALKSDIAVAKKDLAGVHDSLDQAQAAIEQKQKLINDSVVKISNDIEQNRKDMATTRDQLTIAQKSIADNRQALNSSVADINSGIEQDRKDLAAAQQANVDTAKKLDSYTNQAIEQGKTIKELQTDDDSTKMTIADIKGNVSQVQVNVTGLTANLKDANDNLATVKALADSLSATLTDHGKNIASLQATAKELSSTLGDADGRLSKVEQTAEEQSTTLSTVQGDLSQVKQTADGLTDTLKDAQGDITKVQATAKGLSEQITNAQGAITSLQTDVTGIKATITDHDKNIHTLQADAKSLTDNMTDAQGNISKLQKTSGSMESSLEDASGRLSKVEQTAKEHTSTLSDTQGDLSQVKQTADGLVTTLKDAQGNIDKLQQTAKGTAEQISSVQGDITSLQKDVSGIKATITDHDNNIHTLQADSKTLKDDMSDAQGNISKLQKTATSLDSEFKDHDGRISKVEQTASTLTNEFSDEQGHLNRVEQTANGTQQTVSDQQGQINKIKTDADGIHETLTGQDSKIAKINVTLDGLNTKYEGVSGDLNNLKSQTQWVTVTSAVDLNNVITPCHEFLKGTVTNAPNEPAWWYLTVEGSAGNRVTQTVIADQSNNRYTRRFADTWSAWVRDATQTDVTALSGQITTNSTQITQNKQTIALKANQDTVNNLSGEVDDAKAQLKVQAGQISSKVSSEAFKTLDNKVGGAIAQIDKNATAIEQTNNNISLKADQTEVDKVKNTASQLQSSLSEQAGQIQTKVTSSQVTGMLTGYATQEYTQSLITQKAGTISESIVKLNQTVKQGAENNVQLVRKSDFEDGDKGSWNAQCIVSATNPAPPSELGQSGMKVLQTNVRDSYEDDIWYSVKPGEKFDVDFWCAPSATFISTFGLAFADKDKNNWSWLGIGTDNSGQWKHYTGTITAPANAAFAKPWFHMENPADNTAKTAWLAKPSIRRQNATTVAAIQQITASIDGIKSTVANKADQSTVTQLSNVIQSKVSSSDFDNLSKSVELQTLDSVDINNMRTSGHYFVHNLANNPIGGWVYVDVTGNGNDRIRQDVYQDNGIGHKYRRWFGNWWTDWEEGATKSEINQLSDDINLRVTKGDLISQINLQVGTSLIQSDKLVLDAKTTIFTGDAFIPSAAISSISADKIMLGSSAMYDSNGTFNLVNIKDGITSKFIATQGIVNNDGVLGNSSIIDFFSDGHTKSFEVNPSGVTVTPTLFFERYNRNPDHWLGFTRHKARNEGLFFHTWDDNGERFIVGCHARFDRNLSATGDIYQGSWDGTAGKPEAGVLSIKSGNTIWSGSSFLAIGDNISNSFTNVQAKSFSQLSILSSKTNIEMVDTKDALDLVNRTDIRSYQYKTDVAEGKTKRYTSLIIDDVNDVSKYYTPDEFTNEERTGRDDGSAVGYLFLAVQELTKRIKTLEEKLHG